MQWFNKITKHNIQDSKIYLKMGNDFLMNKNYDECVKFYDHAIDIDPNSLEAYVNKGKISTILNRYDDAHCMFDKAHQINPLNYQVPLKKGNIHYDLGEYQQAIELFDMALQMDSQNSDVYLRKGDLPVDLEEMAKSFLIYDKAIQFSNLPHKVCIQIGDKLYNSQKYEESIKYYDISLQIKQNQIAHEKKHTSLIALGDKFISLELFQKACEILEKLEDNLFRWSPTNSNYYKQYSDLLIKLGKGKEALKIFTMSFKFDIELTDKIDFKPNLLRVINEFLGFQYSYIIYA